LTGCGGKMDETTRCNGRAEKTLCRGWMMEVLRGVGGRKLARAGATAKALVCAYWDVIATGEVIGW